MIPIGYKSVLEVVEKAPAGLILSDGDEEILLPNRVVPEGARLGDKLEAFVYTDSEDRPVATTTMPLATVGEFACLKVVDRSRAGSFLDWGLDKDLFLPQTLQHARLEVGDPVVVAVFLDERTDRVAAASKLGPYFDYDLSALKEDQSVQLLVYGFSDRGARVVVDGRYSGLVYDSELYRDVSVGDVLSGYISAVRRDNKLDIRLQRTGAGGRDDAQSVLLAALAEAGGELDLGDKSDPREIQSRLGMSKKAFKAAVGQLYKAGRVQPAPTALRLKAPDEASDTE